MDAGDLMLDKRKAKQLIMDGYTVINLLSMEEVGQLQEFYNKSGGLSEVGSEFYTSIWSNNIDYRRETDIFIESVLFPAVSKHMRNIQPVFSNYMIKADGETSSLLPHQDWSFVEEPEFSSVTVWCPLVDVDKVNGNLQVIPRSHLLNNYIRARFAEAPFRKLDKLALESMLVDIPMKAGEAIILNSRTIHASPNNQSGQNRVAASIVVTSEEAPLYHWEYCRDKEAAVIKKYAVTRDFFWEHSCFDTLEKLRYVEKTRYYDEHFSPQELKEVLGHKHSLIVNSVVSFLKNMKSRVQN